MDVGNIGQHLDLKGRVLCSWYKMQSVISLPLFKEGFEVIFYNNNVSEKTRKFAMDRFVHEIGVFLYFCCKTHC